MKYRKTILTLLLLAFTLIPRLASLDSFVTIDEPFWLSVGANYYYALGQREFQNTVYEYHPAVTTMSVITAAFLVDFPDYRGFGQGYFDVDKEKFDPFLIEHGHDPLHLLYLSRLFQVALIVLFALIIFYLLAVLIGDEKAFLAVALISSAPYFLGHSRVLSHEALVAFFTIASILGLVAYLEFERKWWYLFISAVSAALAQLTKSSAMAMFPSIALILAFAVFEQAKKVSFKTALLNHLKILGLWFVQLGLAYFILWPGMWVAPGKMLYEVYGNAFSYAFQGARLQVTHELQPSTFSLASLHGSAERFISQVFIKETPLAWLGLLFALYAVFRQETAPQIKRLILYLLVNAAMFILLFSAAQGRNSPHYIMASHVSMDLIAALGWCILLGSWEMKWATANQFAVRAGGAAVLILFQLFSAASNYPYYYTYNNPIAVAALGYAPASDYGEGFEQAAVYLNQKPKAEELTAFAFRGRGPFSYFFKGKTIILNPLFVEEPQMASMLERIKQSDYLVINDAFAPRTPNTQRFVDALGIEPEHSIEIKNISTLRIYRVADLPDSFYRLFSE
ncbi:MAG: glycosyltransferase family 39 protein [Anaerolineales bacterium]|nr:glycosyltransferase family 39 protein [Anaerolineales bacterium]